jgi:hypothetical protein
MEGAILTLFIEFVRHSKSSTISNEFREFCRQEVGLSDEEVVEKIAKKFDQLHKRIHFYLLQTSRLV